MSERQLVRNETARGLVRNETNRGLVRVPGEALSFTGSVLLAQVSINFDTFMAPPPVGCQASAIYTTPKTPAPLSTWRTRALGNAFTRNFTTWWNVQIDVTLPKALGVMSVDELLVLQGNWVGDQSGTALDCSRLPLHVGQEFCGGELDLNQGSWSSCANFVPGIHYQFSHTLTDGQLVFTYGHSAITPPDFCNFAVPDPGWIAGESVTISATP